MLLASGLFLVVEEAHALGLGMLLTTISGTGHDPLSLLRLAGDPVRLIALLIGVNVGTLITPWASLAASSKADFPSVVARFEAPEDLLIFHLLS